VAVSRGATLRPSERLRAASEYRRVFRVGLRLEGPLFLLLAAERAGRPSRLGIVASRRMGAAVARNRAKRLVREAFRRNKPAAGTDLVVVGKRELAESGLAEVERELRARLRRLAARRGGGSRRSGAAAPD
jgi:ribonuclease P protein component